MGVKSGGGRVALLAGQLAQLGQGDRFGCIGGLFRSTQDCGQFAIELNQALTLLDPLR
jgi:hypothetical protein